MVTSESMSRGKALSFESRGDRRQEWRIHCQIPHTETSPYCETSRYRAVYKRRAADLS